jgi:hypothetical protein
MMAEICIPCSEEDHSDCERPGKPEVLQFGLEGHPAPLTWYPCCCEENDPR